MIIIQFEDFPPKIKMHINGVVAKYMDSYVRDHLVWTPEQLCADFVAYLKKLHSRGCYGDYELIDGEIAPLHKDGQLWMVSSDANTYLMDKFNRKYEKHKVLARKKAPLFDRIRLGYRWDTTKFYDLNYGLKNGSDYEKADIVEKSTIVIKKNFFIILRAGAEWDIEVIWWFFRSGN